MTRALTLTALIVLSAAPVRAQDAGKDKLLGELLARLARIDARPVPNAALRRERAQIVERIARLEYAPALRQLVTMASEQRYPELQGEIVALIAEHYEDDPAAVPLMRSFLDPDDPMRVVARRFLVEYSEVRKDPSNLLYLFEIGTIEDKFEALKALGNVGSGRTLEFAEALIRDRTWEPQPGTEVTCGTIARALQNQQGPEAARLLLLLRRDDRFLPGDERAFRTATRLWRHPDLVGYIRMADLASPDVDTRVSMARFLGEAGIERARAPLVHLAFRTDEPVRVREEAVRALGNLRIARADLAERLASLLRDPQERVRVAAVRGLARLRVRQAAEALVSLLEGPLAEHARAALSEESGLSPGTDWRDDPRSPVRTWPEGT